jgi:hypothetical protein
MHIEVFAIPHHPRLLLKGYFSVLEFFAWEFWISALVLDLLKIINTTEPLPLRSHESQQTSSPRFFTFRGNRFLNRHSCTTRTRSSLRSPTLLLVGRDRFVSWSCPASVSTHLGLRESLPRRHGTSRADVESPCTPRDLVPTPSTPKSSMLFFDICGPTRIPLASEGHHLTPLPRPVNRVQQRIRTPTEAASLPPSGLKDTSSSQTSIKGRGSLKLSRIPSFGSAPATRRSLRHPKIASRSL